VTAAGGPAAVSGGTSLLVPGLGRNHAGLLRLLGGVPIDWRSVDLYGADPTGVGFHPFAERIDRAAARHRATRVIAESFAASALLHSLVHHRAPLTDAVLLVPFAFDRPRLERSQVYAALRNASHRADPPEIVEILLGQLHPTIRPSPAAAAWAQAAAARFLQPDVQHLLSWLPFHSPVTTDVHDIATRLLVIAQPHDPDHPVEIAHRIGSAFPQATVVVLPQPGAVITMPQEVAQRIAGFLQTGRRPG
jgi:hypothetical protein